MKMHEVCKRTGLTERAVRLYVEKGLVHPASDERRGRVYLEFSDADVEQLAAIGRLRALDFSLDDLSQMLLFPERTRSIVANRRAAAINSESAVRRDLETLQRLEQSGAQSLTALAEVVARPAPPPVPAAENTSGCGDSAYGLRAPHRGRWNWGAFLLPVPWGIGNKCYIAFLCYAPIVGLFVPFWLGAHGYEQAWRNRYWESEEHFLRVQKKWRTWGIIISLLLCAIFILQFRVQQRRAAELNALLEQRQETITNDPEHLPPSPSTVSRLGYELTNELAGYPPMHAHCPYGWGVNPIAEGDIWAWHYETVDGVEVLRSAQGTLYKNPPYPLDEYVPGLYIEEEPTPMLVTVYFDEQRAITDIEIEDGAGEPYPEIPRE